MDVKPRPKTHQIKLAFDNPKLGPITINDDLTMME